MNKKDIGFYIHEPSGMYLFGVDETEDTIIGFIMNSGDRGPGEYGSYFKNWFDERIAEEKLRPSPEVVYTIFANSRQTEYADVVDDYFKHFIAKEKFSITEDLKFIKNKNETIVVDKISSVKDIGNDLAEVVQEGILKQVILPVEQIARLRNIIETGNDLGQNEIEEIKSNENGRRELLVKEEKERKSNAAETKRRKDLESLYLTDQFYAYLETNEDEFGLIDYNYNISVVPGEYFYGGYRLIDSPFISEDLHEVTTHCQNYENVGIWLNTKNMDSYDVKRLEEEQDRLPNLRLAQDFGQVLKELKISDPKAKAEVNSKEEYKRPGK